MKLTNILEEKGKKFRDAIDRAKRVYLSDERPWIIGYSGGSSTRSYDRCTFGAHLHLTIATGLYGVDYNDWTYQLNRVHSIDPRTVINFPLGIGNPWTDRVTAY